MKIPIEVWREAKAISIAEGKSMTRVVTELLAEYIRKHREDRE